MVAHKHAHFELRYIFQHFQGFLHDLIQLLLNLGTFPIYVFELRLCHRHQRVQVLFLFVQRWVDFFQYLGSVVVLLCDSDQIMHQHFSRTVVPFDLAIHANRSVAL
jgi:hypothetical protein